MKNLLLLFVMVLSLAPSFAQSPTTVMCADCDTKEITISLSEKWDVPHSLYNAICMENDIEPGKIGMNEFRRLAKEYAIRVGLVYTNYTFNGTQNIEILHAKVIQNENTTSTSANITRNNSNLHNIVSNVNTSTSTIGVVHSDTITHYNKILKDEKAVTNTKMVSNTLISNSTTDIIPSINDTDIYGVDTVTVVTNTITLVDTIIRYIESERTITKTVVDTFTVFVVVPVDAHVPFCNCADKTYEELNQYYTETLRNRRLAKDPELKDRYGFCAYQIRRYKAQMKKRPTSSGKDYTFEEIVPNLGIGDSRTTASAPPKKRRSRKLGKGHARTGNTGFWAKLFPFLNC